MFDVRITVKAVVKLQPTCVAVLVDPVWKNEACLHLHNRWNEVHHYIELLRRRK
jgi:hypothetical protein